MIDRSGIGVTPSRTDSLFASRELGHPEAKARLPTVSITRSHLRHAIVALVCVCAAMGLVYCPYLLDLPLTHLVNRGVHKSPALNVAFYDLDEFAIFSGGAFLALLWACWFSAEPWEKRRCVPACSPASLSVFRQGFSAAFCSTGCTPIHVPSSIRRSGFTLYFRAPYSV